MRLKKALNLATQILVRLALKTSSLLMKRVSYSRVAAWMQGGFVIACELAFIVLLKLQGAIFTGHAIAALAVLAVLMTTREGMQKREKFVWVLLAFLLFGVEVHIIDQDHLQQETENRDAVDAQSMKFQAVLNQNALQFAETMKAASKIFGKADEAAKESTLASNQITGGNSFAYIDFSLGLTSIAKVVKIGKPPLYELSAKATVYSKCSPFPCRIVATGLPMSIGAFPVGSTWQDDMTHPINAKELIPSNLTAIQEERVYVTVDLTARNGTWREFWWLSQPKNNRYFSHGYRVYKIDYDSRGIQKGATLLRQYIDPCLPVEMLGFDNLGKKHSLADRFYELEDGHFKEHRRRSCEEFMKERFSSMQP